MLCFSLGSRLRGNDGGGRGNDGVSPSPSDPLLISPWEGREMARGRGDVPGPAPLGVPACAGMTRGLARE